MKARVLLTMAQLLKALSLCALLGQLLTSTAFGQDETYGGSQDPDPPKYVLQRCNLSLMADNSITNLLYRVEILRNKTGIIYNRVLRLGASTAKMPVMYGGDTLIVVPENDEDYSYTWYSTANGFGMSKSGALYYKAEIKRVRIGTQAKSVLARIRVTAKESKPKMLRLTLQFNFGNAPPSNFLGKSLRLTQGNKIEPMTIESTMPPINLRTDGGPVTVSLSDNNLKFQPSVSASDGASAAPGEEGGQSVFWDTGGSPRFKWSINEAGNAVTYNVAPMLGSPGAVESRTIVLGIGVRPTQPREVAFELDVPALYGWLLKNREYRIRADQLSKPLADAEIPLAVALRNRRVLADSNGTEATFNTRTVVPNGVTVVFPLFADGVDLLCKVGLSEASPYELDLDRTYITGFELSKESAGVLTLFNAEGMPVEIRVGDPIGAAYQAMRPLFIENGGRTMITRTWRSDVEVNGKPKECLVYFHGDLSIWCALGSLQNRITAIRFNVLPWLLRVRT